MYAPTTPDYALPSPPGDGISDMAFSPNGTLITAGSWDNVVSKGNNVTLQLHGYLVSL